MVVGQMFVGQMFVGQMFVVQMFVGQMFVSQIVFDQMVFDQIIVGQIVFDQMTWSQTYKIVCTDVLVLHHLVNLPFVKVVFSYYLFEWLEKRQVDKMIWVL